MSAVAADLATVDPSIDLIGPVEAARWAVQALEKHMRRQLEPLALDGTLSSVDFQKLLPGAEAIWHDPRHLPPRTRPKVPATPDVEKGYSFRMRNITVTWRSKDFAAHLHECDMEELCKVDMFQPECWRTLPGRQPPKPPPQCFLCRPDQAVTLHLPALSAGEDEVLTLALPTLSVLPPQLSSDVFRMEVRQGSFAVSALHSRAMQQLNAAVAMMKHSLDAQLVVRRIRALGWDASQLFKVVRSVVQQLFDSQRDAALAQLSAAFSEAADAIAELAAERSHRDGHERVAVDAMAALANRLKSSWAEASAELAEQHAWAQERLLATFCSDKDYLYKTC